MDGKTRTAGKTRMAGSPQRRSASNSGAAWRWLIRVIKFRFSNRIRPLANQTKQLDPTDDWFDEPGRINLSAERRRQCLRVKDICARNRRVGEDEGREDRGGTGGGVGEGGGTGSVKPKANEKQAEGNRRKRSGSRHWRI